MIPITVDITRETADAILVDDENLYHEVWLPKSLIRYRADVPAEAVEVEVPEWLAEREGLV
jgi:hypothetical protein